MFFFVLSSTYLLLKIATATTMKILCYTCLYVCIANDYDVCMYECYLVFVVAVVAPLV